MNKLTTFALSLMLVLGAAMATAPQTSAQDYRDGYTASEDQGFERGDRRYRHNRGRAYGGDSGQYRRFTPRRGGQDYGADRGRSNRQYELACSSSCRRACARAYQNCRASRRVCLAQRSACLRSCGC